ncbi:MAG: hypothetical protein RMH97_05335, partial [Verrucomicrobiales bacterium]|nr:hypothetical protein [Verrucomicrobiales bacterium]
MKEITQARWIKIKAILFLLTGALASVSLLIRCGELATAVLLTVSVWSFCRFYYCAFYVIERYVDPGYRFSGLWSFLIWLVRNRAAHKPPNRS